MKDIPLLLLHGYPFDHSMWFSTIAALGAVARVYAPDFPGFGKAELPAGKKPSLDLVADSLVALLDEHKHEKAVLAGMSMGGYVALAFAHRHRDRLAGLGLISSQAGADSTETRFARKEMIKHIRGEGPMIAVQALLPKMFASEKPKNPELAQMPERAAMAAGPDALCWALQAMADRADRTLLLQELMLPVLIAHGSEDRIVPCAKARQLAESCQLPIFVEMRGVGHASPLEAPDQVAIALARLMTACRENQPGHELTRPTAAS